jgi:SagB-type dehydrogenase family enzyme
MSKSLSLVLAAVFAVGVFAAEKYPLEPPQKTGGEGFFTVLAQRRSIRKFSEVPLSVSEISTLLWAGFGISGDKDRRTAPTAANRREFTLYAIFPEGAYKYLPESNEVERVSTEDLRPLAAGNVTAPGYILIVADLKRAASEEYAAIDSGYISQNLYLAATAMKLGSCALGSFRRNEENVAKLKSALGLAEHEKPILSQAVGKPE